MDLLVDVGNTTVQYQVYQQQRMITKNYFSSHINSDELIEKIIFEIGPYLRKITNLVISNVKPDLDEGFKYLEEQYHWKTLNVSGAIKTNFTYDIDNFTAVGADLIATASGAVAKYGDHDIIIIDMGTATTIMTLKNNVFLGGAILPGLGISGDALIENTALLTKSPWKLPKNGNLIGRNTKDAISVGIIYGHACAIKGLVEDYTQSLDNPLVLLLGGYHTAVKSLLNYDIEEDLLFDGLRELWNLNQGEE